MEKIASVLSPSDRVIDQCFLTPGYSDFSKWLKIRLEYEKLNSVASWQILDASLEWKAGLLIEFFRSKGIALDLASMDETPFDNGWVCGVDNRDFFFHENPWEAFADGAIEAFNKINKLP